MNLNNGQSSDKVNGDMSSSSGWCAEDMLATNSQKYGYKSTYDSNLTEYTIPIEKEDSEEYRRREEEAERMVLICFESKRFGVGGECCTNG